MWKPAEVSGGFVLLAAWFALENGLRPLLILISAAAVHELGHLAALWWYRAPVYALRLGSAGAVLDADRSHLSYGQELVVLLAGPAVNLICGGILSRCADGRMLWYEIAGAHVLLGLFNLLPIRTLDGGQALRMLLAWRCGAGTGETGCEVLNWLTALTLCGLLLGVMFGSGGSLWLLPAIPAILCSAAERLVEW